MMTMGLAFSILAIFSIIFGFVIGFCTGRKHSPRAGKLVINTTDVEKDVIRIELEMPVAEMLTRNRLEFAVVNEDSQ